MSNFLDETIAVEIDLYDGNEIKTLRLCNQGPVTKLISETKVQFEPRLYIPIQLGSKISAEQYGSLLRGVANGGTIDFAIDEKIWPWLSYHWLGRVFRIYQGNGNKFENLNLVYEGRVADLNYDTTTPKATIKTIDASVDLDAPLVSDLYPNDSVVIALRGKPKPYLRGTVYSVSPVLEDDPTQTYRLSFGKALAEVIELRVGGVPWEQTNLTPGAGQYKVNLSQGTLVLGSTALGGEVLCDVKAIGWESFTSEKFIREIVTSLGQEVDEESFSSFTTAASGLIGFYTIDPINKLDVLDEICFGVGGWWTFGSDGKIRIGVIAAPSLPDIGLSEINISSLQLSGIIPPAWRIRVEYKRNWQPLNNSLPGVTDVDKQNMSASGIIAPAYENQLIKVSEPRAVDVALIRTLFVNEIDAIKVRDRLSEAWGVERRLYDAICWDEAPELYKNANIDYQMINGNFRIHSVVLSIGHGPVALQLWGSLPIQIFQPSPSKTFTPFILDESSLDSGDVLA